MTDQKILTPLTATMTWERLNMNDGYNFFDALCELLAVILMVVGCLLPVLSVNLLSSSQFEVLSAIGFALIVTAVGLVVTAIVLDQIHRRNVKRRTAVKPPSEPHRMPAPTLRSIVTGMRGSPTLIVGGSAVIFYIAIALLAPLLAPPGNSNPLLMPQDLELSKLTPSPTPPTSRHIFGTTAGQYDLCYACIWGTVSAFRMGLLAVLGALAIGVVIAVIAGHLGGFVDELMMGETGFTNFFLAVSPILTILFVIALPSVLSMVDKVLVAVILCGWPLGATVIRNGVFGVRQEEQAAESGGAVTPGVYMFSMLILYAVCVQLAAAVLFSAALGFLGLGAPSNYADWGQIIGASLPWIAQPSLLTRNFHMFLFPGLFLSSFLLGWILLGVGTKEVIDEINRGEPMS